MTDQCVICGIELRVPKGNRILLACLDCVIATGKGKLSKLVLPVPTECLGLERCVIGIGTGLTEYKDLEKRL